MKVLLAILLLAACTAPAQTKTQPDQKIEMPSNAEVRDLLSKASEKVAMFEETVKAAKPNLDKIDSKLSVNYLDAASTAHLMIDSMQKNGASAYGLVGLFATLDDLSLDASHASFQLLRSDEEQVMNGHTSDLTRLASIMKLQSAQVGTNDIAELLMHTTLRFIQAEETALEVLLKEKQ
jgi:hypothetical protein